MPRDYKAYLGDIIDSINKIERYTNNMSFQDFLQNELVQDGVVFVLLNNNQKAVTGHGNQLLYSNGFFSRFFFSLSHLTLR